MRRYELFLVRAEAALAVLMAFFGILTIFWRDWIEGLTGWDPDHHSGSVEIGIVCVFLVASVAWTVTAYVTYRRLRAVTS